jgi:uncharacterized membrane protein SpoIIM required for sporulation
MITEDEFIAARRTDWEELDRLLNQAQRLDRLPGASISRAATLYRALCTDLMRAQGAGFSAETMAYLDALAARAHNAIYSAPPYRLGAAIAFFARDFPRVVRRRSRFFALSAALFVVPALVGFWGGKTSSAFGAGVLPESELEILEQSYSGNIVREGSQNVAMAGFYVNNNIGIAFRCFATGVLFGLGPVFFLVYNGLLIGTTAGLVTRAGHGMNLLTFCCGHSAFELTAIVISGMGGLYMGYLLVVTGGRTRWGSLRAGARELFDIVMGAAAMLAVAALIEGFWSAADVPAPVKWAAGVLFAAVVASYFALAGRGEGADDHRKEDARAP